MDSIIWKILSALSVICGAFTGLYGVYFAAIAVLGTIRRKSQTITAAPQKRIAALIAARNEEAVVGPLVRSLQKQDYPKELYDIYVIPNNCTDDTEAAARAAGAKIITCDVPVHSKGEVLNVAFRQLLALPEAEGYDAFCIFDADNLVHPGYMNAVNQALSDGYDIAQGYRDSKNPDSSWVAGCVSMFYWMMSRFYNSARHALGMSAALNGTGFMVSARLIREHGFQTISLTEDLEYTAQCAINGVKVGWMENAVIYDEQPIRMVDSYNQRRRWSAGTVQCLKAYGKTLYHKAVHERSLACADILLIFAGALIQLISLLPLAFTILYTLGCLVEMNGAAIWIMVGGIIGGVGGYLGSTLMAALICCWEKKMSVKRIPAVIGFSIFLLTWIPANLVSLFCPPPTWKAIPHTVAIDEAELENRRA
ncbi:MAG: glycosyltransferase family 2 protein [Clostridia bacterium]|nr:glycosyltransferase family 2 protein [Clostridia bacterium]